MADHVWDTSHDGHAQPFPCNIHTDYLREIEQLAGVFANLLTSKNLRSSIANTSAINYLAERFMRRLPFFR